MFKALFHVVGTAVALILISRFIPGIVVGGLYTAVIVAIVWGLIGLTVKPILGLLTLPINVLTFGLFSFVLNALLFWGIASFIPGFSVDGFVPALEGSFILSLVAMALHAV